MSEQNETENSNRIVIDFMEDSDPRVEIEHKHSRKIEVFPNCYARVVGNEIFVYHYSDGNRPQQARKVIRVTGDPFTVSHFGQHPAIATVAPAGTSQQLSTPDHRHSQTPVAPFPPAVPPEHYNADEDPNATSGDYPVTNMVPAAAQTPRRKKAAPITGGQPVEVMPLEPTSVELKRKVEDFRRPSFSALPVSPPGSGSVQQEEEASPSAWQAMRQIVSGKDSEDFEEQQEGSEWKPRGNPSKNKFGGHRKVGRFNRAATGLLVPVFLGFALLGSSYSPPQQRKAA